MTVILLSSNERIPRIASLSNVDMIHDDKRDKTNIWNAIFGKPLSRLSHHASHSQHVRPSQAPINLPSTEMQRNNTYECTVLWEPGRYGPVYPMCTRNCPSEVRAPASVQSKCLIPHYFRLTETWMSSWQIGETHVKGRLHLGTKQRQSTSFSHLQCQIVDVHLQSGVSR